MLQIAIDTAKNAGKILTENLGKVRHIEHKGGEATNLVTEVDKESERFIIGTLKKHFPGHDFLGEETGEYKIQSEYRWIIDPLDGTVNYAHGLPIFSVSIALEYKGEIVLGVVYDPSHDELFSAEKGKGAYLNNVRLSVSKASQLIDSLLVTGFPYDVKNDVNSYLNPFKEFMIEGQAIRRLGSAALDLAYVACGRFDGFWEGKLNAWDMAAGVLLVTEAGGCWTDYNGNPSTVYNPKMLATNGRIHQQMVDVLKRCNA